MKKNKPVTCDRCGEEKIVSTFRYYGVDKALQLCEECFEKLTDAAQEIKPHA